MYPHSLSYLLVQNWDILNIIEDEANLSDACTKEHTNNTNEHVH